MYNDKWPLLVTQFMKNKQYSAGTKNIYFKNTNLELKSF